MNVRMEVSAHATDEYIISLTDQCTKTCETPTQAIPELDS